MDTPHQLVEKMRTEGRSRGRRHSRARHRTGRSGEERLNPLEIGILVMVCLAFIVILGLLFRDRAPEVLPVPMLAQSSQPDRSEAELAGASQEQSTASKAGEVLDSQGHFACVDPQVVDGDTLRCGQERVRLASIDAPELPGHCRRGRTCVEGDPFASTDNLKALVAAGNVDCRRTDLDGYGRTIARCTASDLDLSCAQVAGGFAVVRYGSLAC